MSSSSLVFTGDIGFDKYMGLRWKDENLVADDVMEFLHSGDHLIINVEGPLSRQEKIMRENGVAALTHSMNPEVTEFFDRIGADVWNICNNHIMDAGPKGMEDTLKEAKRCNVKTLGAGMNIEEAKAPVYFKEAGGIGLIGAGYQRACRKADENTPGCVSLSDLDTMREQIELIKKTCRWCVVVAHGGEEFTALPSPYTRERYIDFLNMGADIVVAHHPHVPMNYETFREDENGKEINKAIFYSLGNFVFDTDYQRAQFNTEYGILLKLIFTENEFGFEHFSIKIDRNDERIIKGDTPAIFTDVQALEYEKLKYLAARMFIENTKRQLKYLKPAVFNDATEEDFYNNFYEPLRSGRVPGEVLDFQIIYPLSLEAEKGQWKESYLEDVKEFMLRQIPEYTINQ